MIFGPVSVEIQRFPSCFIVFYNFCRDFCLVLAICMECCFLSPDKLSVRRILIPLKRDNFWRDFCLVLAICMECSPTNESSKQMKASLPLGQIVSSNRLSAWSIN